MGVGGRERENKREGQQNKFIKAKRIGRNSSSMRNFTNYRKLRK